MVLQHLSVHLSAVYGLCMPPSHLHTISAPAQYPRHPLPCHQKVRALPHPAHQGVLCPLYLHLAVLSQLASQIQLAQSTGHQDIKWAFCHKLAR